MIGIVSTNSFKTRARAVDMLGRQQIAGIPTAISELFKNAHDAYADNVEVDFFRSLRLFVARDDGLGMSYDEFVRNWLTLGTDAKVKGANGGNSIVPPPNKQQRTILGEKGIGRLAIASIGPQVLVLTRSARNDDAGGLVAAFVNWGLFGLPGIDLDEIKVPIITFPPGALPSTEDIAAMISTVKDSLLEFRGRTNVDLLGEIERQLTQFEIDQSLFMDMISGVFDGRGHGTQFYIQPTDEILESDIDGIGDGTTAPPLVKMLIGFTNTMTPGFNAPVIEAAFRDHKGPGLVEDLIEERQFFTPEEFESADHHLQGEFDEFGQFHGKVAIYGQEPVDHVVPWARARGRKTMCGPFRFNVAVVQGESRNSRLPGEEWGRLVNKLNRIGGLYIFRDGIRVLPYGNNEYDFLDIEKNRTKSAGYYYFSYRRIFGAIEIDQVRNPNLVEKAGREGFRENRAYRQFRDILMNFFAQTAADFFRYGGVNVEIFDEQRAELERLERIKRRRAALVSVRRRRLQNELEEFFQKLDEGFPQKTVHALLQSFKANVRGIDEIRDPNGRASQALSVELNARRDLRHIREELNLTRPRGIGLSRQLRRNWDAYRSEFLNLDETCFRPAEVEIDDTVRAYAQSTRILIDHRRRLEAALGENTQQARLRARRQTAETRQAGEEVSEKVVQLTRDVMTGVEGTIREVLSEIARLDIARSEESDLVDVRMRLEQTVDKATESSMAVLSNVKAQLESMNWTADGIGDIFTSLDILEATESELLDFRERADLDLELTQLGAAVEIINHEFDASIRAIRSNLGRLKAWADVNPSLEGLHNDIRTSFDHLDGYLTLFTPLQRRLYRQKVKIRGRDIIRFLSDLFRERLRRHEVRLDSTRGFNAHTILGYPSTFYPVFVNLIDNSLFWLSDRPHPRRILLDVDDGDIIVSDSGPGIPGRDFESVFELGFTRKPSGRGLGLYISRESLKRVGYAIEIAPKSPLAGATFLIRDLEADRD